MPWSSPSALRRARERTDSVVPTVNGHALRVLEYPRVLELVASRATSELGAERVELLLDSKLIVEQLNGRWRVKDLKLRPLWATTLQTLRTFPGGWAAAHVRRAQNSTADALANEAIDRVASGGPAVVVRRPGG